MEERKSYIDVVKGIGIILVILGHIDYEAFNGWKQFVGSFHMPLFFFVSGILFKEAYVSNWNFSNFLKKRSYRLLLPYFIWGLIHMTDICIEQLLRLMWGNNKLYGSAGLWFLPTMVVALSVCYGLVFIHRKKKILAWITLIGVIFFSFVLDYIGDTTIIGKVGYPFSFDIGLLAGAFIFLGWIYNWKFLINTNSKLIEVVMCVCFLGVTYFISKLNYRFINDPAFDRVVMARGSYGLYPLFLIGGLFGAIGILYLGKIIRKHRLLEFIGKNSLTFMVTNHLSIQLINNALSYTRIDVDNWNVIIIVGFYLSFSVVLCSIAAIIVRKFIPILGGV